MKIELEGHNADDVNKGSSNSKELIDEKNEEEKVKSYPEINE